MKKSFKILITLLLVLGFATVSNAGLENDLMEYLSKTYVVDGKEVTVPSKYLKEAERYLETYDVTAEEADKVKAKIDEGVEIFNKEKVSEVSKLSAESKQKLLSVAQEAASEVGAKITYTKTNGLTVIGEDGKTFGTYKIGSKFVQTGSQYYYVASAAIIAIAGILIYRKIK